MNTFKTVLFDWEGVIGPQDTRSFGWLMKRLPVEYSVEEEWVVEALGQNIGEFMVGHIDNVTFWARVGNALGVTFTEEFQQTIWRDWHGAVPIPEMKQLVKEIKARSLRTIAFSNILPPNAAHIRELAGYEGFDAELLSCEVGLAKPNPMIYQRALELANCAPEECIFIDDKAANLMPAMALGMTTILAENPEQIRTDLLSLLKD
jgi:epoxide hydrolase-like predicted phosphatase